MMMRVQFLESFATIWKDGYFEGTPTDPMAASTYGIVGYHSSLYLAYVCCIKPYVRADATVIEIGSGRGAWTKAIADLNPERIYAVDVVTPEYSGFWNYVGKRKNVEHIIVEDFSLSGIPDASADYFFSFGCFCHLKPDMCVSYIHSLSHKMKPGAHGFLMIADFDKFNACFSDYKGHSLWRAFVGKRFALVRLAFRLTVNLFQGKFIPPKPDKAESDSAKSGAWFHLGVDNACNAISEAGFHVIERDMQINHRDPIIHFIKL
jgi:SAM-dependent methyltransferase